MKDDVMIILGISKMGQNSGKHEPEVKDAVIRLLQDELGIEVLTVIPKIAYNRKPVVKNSLTSKPNMEEMFLRDNFSTEVKEKVESTTRRPVVLQRLKITRKSIQQWLQRRMGKVVR